MVKHRFLRNFTCNQIGRSHLSPATRSPKWRPGRRTGHTNIKELARHAHRLKRQSHTGREKRDSMKTRKTVSEEERQNFLGDKDPDPNVWMATTARRHRDP